MTEFFVRDLEYELMSYCLKQRGKWWASHWFRNKEVNELYFKLRTLDAGTIICIVQDGGPDYQKHIDFFEEKIRPILEMRS